MFNNQLTAIGKSVDAAGYAKSIREVVTFDDCLTVDDVRKVCAKVMRCYPGVTFYYWIPLIKRGKILQYDLVKFR